MDKDWRNELITKGETIDALRKLEFSHLMEFGEYIGEDSKEVRLIRAEKAQDTIECLPSAQPQITLESAIDFLHEIGWMQEHDRILTESGMLLERMNGLPSAQPEQSSEIQDILEYLDTVLHPIISPDHWNVYSELYDMISVLPSAQPQRCEDCANFSKTRLLIPQPEKRTEERTETHTCVYQRTETHARDLIDRQAAIDALDVLCQEHRYKIPGKVETYSQYNEAWQDALDRAEGAIGNLPSAQPQACDDAISREDAKWVVFCNRDHVEDQTNAIDSLPCAQPQRMRGKWERHYSRPNVFADLYWHCSICGYKNSENWANIYHRYCPHCGSEMLLESHEEVSYSPSSGADMRGEEDE